MMTVWWHRRTVAGLLILACGVGVFHNSFGNSFHYDDEHSILENPHVRSLANIPRFFVDPGTFSGFPEARMYRPLLLATYALNYAAGGYEVFGYHLRPRNESQPCSAAQQLIDSTASSKSSHRVWACFKAPTVI